MDNIKPSVIIYRCGSCNAALHEILSGIEEEGVPYEVYKADGDVNRMAYEAAQKSPLGIGIGIDDNKVCAGYRNMNIGEPLFMAETNDRVLLRILGCNAARYVKGIPFIIND